MFNRFLALVKKDKLDLSGAENSPDSKAPVCSDNALRIIVPYFFEGTWVFDDKRVNLIQEPFVAGVPEMIDELVENIPNAKFGFRLLFSAGVFPGYQKKLVWIRSDMGGNWYKLDGTVMEGWLCPALFKYYTEAPNELYIKAEPKDRSS